MATPTIEAISTQDITIDTDYELEIGITNDPEEVTVDGLLEGFGYSWDADNDTLTIAGESTRLLGDAIWVVSAKETPASTAVTREITYNVVSSAPIIEEVGEQTVYKGFESDIFIPVENRATILKADGLLLGLKYESGSREHPDDSEETQEGIRITGMVVDGELTVEDTNLMLAAETDGGVDTYAMPVVISDENPPSFFLFHVTSADSTFRKVDLEDEMIDEVLMFTPPEYINSSGSGGIGDFVISSDNIIYQVYGFFSTNGLGMQVIVFDALTEDGQTAISIKTFYVLYEGTRSIAIDSNDNLYLAGGRPVPVTGGSNTNRVYVVSPETANGTAASLIKYNDLPADVSRIGVQLAIDGDDLYIVKQISSDVKRWQITVSSINIANGGTLPVNRRFDTAVVPDPSLLAGATINNDFIYITGSSGGTAGEPKIWVVDKNTINGNIAQFEEEYTTTASGEISDSYSGIAFG